MELDHAVLWVESAKRALEFYVDVLGLAPVRAQDFEDGNARFPSVRLNEGTIFDLMEASELLPLVQKFTGGGEGIGGVPINHLCLSMNLSEYEAVSARRQALLPRLPACHQGLLRRPAEARCPHPVLLLCRRASNSCCPRRPWPV